MRRALLAAGLMAGLGLCFSAVAAVPAAAEIVGPEDRVRYERCLTAIEDNPDQAFEAAITWQAEGGGVPAAHCAAVALGEAGHADEAARRLEALSEDPGAGDLIDRAEILSHAGNLWMLAGKPAEADAALTRALNLFDPTPKTAAVRQILLEDRARARLLGEAYRAAQEDASAALSYGETAQLFLIRGRARRGMADFRAAMADLDRAVALDPGNAVLYLERGLVREQLGEVERAKADWLEAAVLAEEGGPVAAAAQEQIARYALK